MSTRSTPTRILFLSVLVKDRCESFVAFIPNGIRDEVLWKRNAFRFTSDSTAGDDEVIHHETIATASTVVAVVFVRKTYTVQPYMVTAVCEVCETAMEVEEADVATFGIADKVVPHEILPLVITLAVGVMLADPLPISARVAEVTASTSEMYATVPDPSLNVIALEPVSVAGLSVMLKPLVPVLLGASCI